VIKNLPVIIRNLSFCKKDIVDFKPDTLILIDYPGFNIRIAKWAKQQKFNIVYYISPQVWAWKEDRVKTIKKCVDKMLVILPFEKEFYKKWNYEVHYVGHPLVEVVHEFRENKTDSIINNAGKGIIALLPGSRTQEILKKLPVMLQASLYFPEYTFVVAKAPGVAHTFYDDILKAYPKVLAIQDQTYSLLTQSSAALVTSGTATLETALFGVPQIICYKANPISYTIAKKLIKIKFIGLVNLIMNKEVVKELIQDELKPEILKTHLTELLYNRDKQNQVREDYRTLNELLSSGGNASYNAAKLIVDFTRGLSQ
jgi:lipid-A-disaccharide synthase